MAASCSFRKIVIFVIASFPPGASLMARSKSMTATTGPPFACIRNIRGTNVARAKNNIVVTILGGPPLYFEKYGPPRMRARHLPFEIDESARQVWLRCFEKVLEGADVKYQFPMEHMEGFKDFLKSFSAWMVNKA